MHSIPSSATACTSDKPLCRGMGCSRQQAHTLYMACLSPSNALGVQIGQTYCFTLQREKLQQANALNGKLEAELADAKTTSAQLRVKLKDGKPGLFQFEALPSWRLRLKHISSLQINAKSSMSWRG